VKEAIIEDIAKRYQDDETCNFLLKCCTLDPRFRGLPFENEEKKSEVYASMHLETVKLNTVSVVIH
jgi:hypothetical protein